ncbi:histidine kinase dimerization/phospho-acceptor domain-containing protein [Ramlibacter sp. PS3R-8]|uniref:histidine kinase dimerization/phospho-acceptor domain-containing protein n=1 Tax=Ramlibacter sp. PS3R-8 TaxID=3133437 RepID=UPI00309D7C00
MPPRPFQLTRYFTTTSLVAFCVLGAALFFLQLGEERFFAGTQAEQAAFFAKVQGDLLQEQKENARASLVAVHEAGHINLTRVFANALWASHLQPLVAQAQAVPIGPCRLPMEADVAGRTAAEAKLACIAKVRSQVHALPAFAKVDGPVRALMRTTNVFKIKVYDLRGLTVYSSEAVQVGEDKVDNAGWKAAAAGKVASELVHRNQFSAFEGVVKDRDLIQSYIPVAAAGGGIGGVFEIYSDVTPLLQQLEAASARSAAASARHRDRLLAGAAANQEEVESASTRLLLTVLALLGLTYGALLSFVRRGQRVIDQESRARAHAAEREQDWHREKMGTIGAMAANISHEVGNPLAIIAGLAREIQQWREQRHIKPEFARMIVEQTARISALTGRIGDFAQPGRDTLQLLDVNDQVRAVSDFLGFDRRFHGTPIELRLGARLPACHGVPDHLTEVLMALLQALEHACEDCRTPSARLVVETSYLASVVTIRMSGFCGYGRERCEFPANDPRVDSARQLMEGMGGHIEAAGPAVEVHLMCAMGDPAPAAEPDAVSA